jgi:hypothetical protein
VSLYDLPKPLPSKWHELLAEFDVLKGEQSAPLCMTGDYTVQTVHGRWSLFNCSSEHLEARFALAATRAGTELRSPQDILPHDYWFDRLYDNLVANQSSYATTDGPARVILDACVASATFCARLERAELEGTLQSMIIRDPVSIALNEFLSGSAMEEAASSGISSNTKAERSVLRDRYFASFQKRSSFLICVLQRTNTTANGSDGYRNQAQSRMAQSRIWPFAQFS